MKAAIAFVTFVISTIIFVVFTEWVRAADLAIEIKAVLMALFFLAGIALLYLAGYYIADILEENIVRHDDTDDYWVDEPATSPVSHVQLQDPPYDYEKENEND